MHNANLYEVSNALQRRDAGNLFQEFSPRLQWQQSELILDIGCGSGDVTNDILIPGIPKMSTKHHNVVGVDISGDMVSHAKSAHGGQHVSFAQMDISKEIPSNKITRKFSKIFSFYCLHWIKDQGVTLHNIHHLLEPGGEALLLFLAKNPLFEAYRRMASKPEWAPIMQDVEKFVPAHQDCTDPSGTFSHHLDAVGFQVTSCEARNMEYTFGNVNQLVAAVKAVNPFVERVQGGPKEQMRYMCELLAELKGMETPGMDTGRAVARYTLMVAHVKKPMIVNSNNGGSNSNYNMTTNVSKTTTSTTTSTTSTNTGGNQTSNLANNAFSGMRRRISQYSLY